MTHQLATMCRQLAALAARCPSGTVCVAGRRGVRLGLWASCFAQVLAGHTYIRSRLLSLPTMLDASHMIVFSCCHRPQCRLLFLPARQARVCSQLLHLTPRISSTSWQCQRQTCCTCDCMCHRGDMAPACSQGGCLATRAAPAPTFVRGPGGGPVRCVRWVHAAHAVHAAAGPGTPAKARPCSDLYR